MLALLLFYLYFMVLVASFTTLWVSSCFIGEKPICSLDNIRQEAARKGFILCEDAYQQGVELYQSEQSAKVAQYRNYVNIMNMKKNYSVYFNLNYLET